MTEGSWPTGWDHWFRNLQHWELGTYQNKGLIIPHVMTSSGHQRGATSFLRGHITFLMLHYKGHWKKRTAFWPQLPRHSNPSEESFVYPPQKIPTKPIKMLLRAMETWVRLYKGHWWSQGLQFPYKGNHLHHILPCYDCHIPYLYLSFIYFS